MLCRSWGVKTVNAIYVGAGSVKQVWPAYTDYGGDTVNMLGTTDFIARGMSFDYETYRTVSSYSGGTYAYTGYTSSGSWANMAPDGTSTVTSWSGGKYTHWYETTKIDTRGYNYIMMHFVGNMYDTNLAIYLCPGLSYYTGGSYTWDEISPNLKHSSSYVSSYGYRSSTTSTHFNNYGRYVLYDITNLNEEAIYVFFGGRVSCAESSKDTDIGKTGQLVIDECKLYQSKPSGANITFAY